MAQDSPVQIAPQGKGKPEKRNCVAWWTEDEKHRSRAVEDTVRTIRQDQSEQRTRMLRYLRMYRNYGVSSLHPWAWRQIQKRTAAPLSLNCTRNMINTVVSKIGKIRPRAKFQTSGGTREMKEKARKLEQWSDGFVYQEDVYAKGVRACIDALVFGTGYLKVYPDFRKNCVGCERVYTPEILVDTLEGFNQTPRNLYHAKWIDREVAKAIWPKHADALDSIDVADFANEDADMYGDEASNSVSDMIEIYEAWHLPSVYGAGDGLHEICAGEAILFSEKWEEDFFPFATVRWTDVPAGWEGMGLAEELAGIQVEINRIIQKIQLSFNLLANPYVLVDRASGVSKSNFSGIQGSFIQYNGREPRVYAPQTVHQEVFAHLDRLYQLAYEIAGVSQMAASSRVPSNLESGRAILVNEDVQSDRFASFQQTWERFHMDIVKRGIHAASQLPKYNVKLFGEDGYQEVNFKKDIDLDRDHYVMQVFPTAFIAGTPSGQLDNAERLLKAQVVSDPGDVMELMEAPDLKGLAHRRTAGKKLIERMIENILKGEKFRPPESALDLPLAIKTAREMYLEAEFDGVPRARLQKVNIWIALAESLLSQGQSSEPQPAGMGMPPGPGGEMLMPGGPMPPGMAPPMPMGPEAAMMPPEMTGAPPTGVPPMMPEGM